MAEQFPGEHFDELVPHPFDQAVAEMMDAQRRIDADEASASDMQRMLDGADVPEREALREVGVHVNQFEVPDADAVTQVDYIMEMEAYKIILEAVANARVQEPPRALTVIADHPEGNIDPTTLARSKPRAIDAIADKLSTEVLFAIDMYSARERDRRAAYDPNDPCDPGNK